MKHLFDVWNILFVIDGFELVGNRHLLCGMRHEAYGAWGPLDWATLRYRFHQNSAKLVLEPNGCFGRVNRRLRYAATVLLEPKS